MAKFCANCGSPMEEGDRVCGQCGTPVAGVNPANPPHMGPVSDANPVRGAQVSPANGSSANGSNKLIILIGAGIAAVVALVIIINILLAVTGYKATLNKMARALAKDDVETLISMSSYLSDEYYESMYGKDYEEYYENMIDSALDKFDDEVGDVKKVTLEVTDEKVLSKRKMDDIEDAMNEYYHADISGIKKIIEVDIRLKVKGSSKNPAVFPATIYVVKEDGKWKLFYGDLSY